MKDIVFKTIMLKGEAGSSISSVEKTGSVGNVDTYTIHFNDDTPDFTFEVTNGYSIISIEKTSTLGNIDTYTVTLDNGETYTFTVTNANVVNSMTAADETTTAPSIAAVKSYGGDGDGILFCGDFVNYPEPQIDISDEVKNIGGYRACGWYIPSWLERDGGEGLHVKKTPVGFRSSFYSPQYIRPSYSLKDFGVDQAIISVEWAKLVGEDEYEIHTSTKLITDTSVEIGRPIVNFETDVNFALMSLFDGTYKGVATFGMFIDAAEITGDYYIRKIKIEKGTIATPFGLNRDQFLTNNILKNLFYEGTHSGTTDANGVYYTSIDVSSIGDITNLKIVGVAFKCGDDVYFSSLPPMAVELGYSLSYDGQTGKTWLYLYFKYPSKPNTQIDIRIFYSGLKIAWS